MSKLWIKAALIRAAKTMAQVAAAMIGTGMVGILDVDWMNVLSVTVVSGILSILTSIAGLPEVTLDAKPDIPEGYFENELDEDPDGDVVHDGEDPDGESEDEDGE